ncbi:unnamed protein product [Rotaria magnacalcarata]|uniref:Uncharacterized protein n=1 Tax=Rotaria magnacalcarata TaxID=392030 RepID=A0A816RLA4_9BILA|nr:unnamed protein product [Rotaria magnacalcarata]
MTHHKDKTLDKNNMNLNVILRSVILILLIGSITETIAGPLAYAACISTCLAALSTGGLIVGALAGGASCPTICAPALVAPTP